jgi:hypothetical protein
MCVFECYEQLIKQSTKEEREDSMRIFVLYVAPAWNVQRKNILLGRGRGGPSYW